MRSKGKEGPNMQPGRRILTPVEREGLNRELRTIESDRAGEVEGVPRRMQGFIDKEYRGSQQGAMDDRERRIRRTLASGAPDPLVGNERVKVETLEKQLRESLQKRMITRKMMALRPGSIEFTKAKNSMAKNEMSAEFNKDAAAWKNLRRRLDPEDPDAANLEAIRPE